MHDLTLHMDDNPINLETVLQILRFRQFELQQLNVLRKTSGGVSVRLSVTGVSAGQAAAERANAEKLVLQLAKRPGISSVNLG